MKLDDSALPGLPAVCPPDTSSALAPPHEPDDHFKMPATPASGVDWPALTEARRALIQNPYQVEHKRLTAARFLFAKHMDAIPDAMRDLCVRGLDGDALKLVLAAAHHAGRIGQTETWLPLLERGVDACGSRELGLDTRGLRRVAWALSRFNVAIGKLIGSSDPMRQLREKVWTASFGPSLFETLDRELAIRQQSILILGEPGTGKELVANVIQAAVLSDSAAPPPTQAINCAAITETLMEAELFGSEKGAFTGSEKKRVGKIVAADGGTLFLDEVADLPLHVQAKLLSVLANGQVTPIGSNAAQKVDVRYIAATSRPINERVQEQTFRDDLYSRLAHTIINVAPLRVRPDDIYEIAAALHEKLTPRRAPQKGVSTLGITDSVTQEHAFRTWMSTQMAQRSWRSNVRELEAVVREHVLGFREPTQPLPVAGDQRLGATSTGAAGIPASIQNCTASLKYVEDWYFRRAYADERGNVTRTAEALRVDRATVQRRMKEPPVEEDTGEKRR
jgi:DNA-binding NtrC family response regulator